jgi:hypothetical protein
MGPCLCCDPYCSSCGNLTAMELEDAKQALMEVCAGEQLNVAEYKFLYDAVPSLIKTFRKSLIEWENERKAIEAEKVYFDIN